MAQYAEQVSGTKLFKQLDALVDREDVTAADVVKLKQLVLDVADAVGPHLDRIRDTFWQYTEHDLRHLCNVVDLVYRFLPKTGRGRNRCLRLNALELAVLWVAILLHDVGMYVSEDEKQGTLDSEDYRSYLRHQPDRVEAAQKARATGLEVKARAIEDALLAEYFRRLHPERVRDYIAKRLRQRVRLEFRGVDLEDDIGNLCESHAWGVRESNDPRNLAKCVARIERNRRVGSTRVNLQYLACCLRLGDILDFDKSRAPLTVYDEIDFTEEKSSEEWNKHLSIDGWDVAENRVLFDVRCIHPAYYVAVHDFLNWVDHELRECRYLLDDTSADDEEKYSLELPHAVDRRQVRMRDPKYVAGGFRFRLEYDEIMQLLMDKSLYPDASLFLRELLQNSLDACRYQQALAKEAGMEDKYIPRIIVWDYSQDEKDPRIVFQDNGIGMSQHQIENFFLRVGKSFYKSPEFAAERQRLADEGIHLDACSQFGIGFLSCFLVGDHIEVETFRFGSVPLRVTITGPSKYFVIERMEECRTSIQFKSPENHLDDRPPRQPGTRVVVHIRNSFQVQNSASEENLVCRTLTNFAVNQEFEIRIFAGASRELLAIVPRRWEASIPPFPLVFDSVRQKHCQSEVLNAILTPAIFDLQLHSDQLRGVGVIWMLRDADDSPTPLCGDLRLKGSEIIIATRELHFLNHLLWYVLPREFAAKESFFFFFASILRRFGGGIGETAREEVEEWLAFNVEDAEHQKFWEFADEYFDDVMDLPLERREWVARVCESQGNKLEWSRDFSGPWSQKTDVVRSLRSGDREFFKSGDALYVDLDALTIESRYSISLFGINVPARLASWEPDRAKSTKPVILPSSVTVMVDAYGKLAPQPSVSRLFIPIERADPLRTAVGRAALRHALALYEQHISNPEWRHWISSFLDGCQVIAGAVLEELQDLQEFFLIPCRIENQKQNLSLLKICERFGDRAPAVTNDQDREDGVVAQGFLDQPMRAFLRPHWLVRHLPRKKILNGKEVVDLSRIRAKLGI